MSSQIIIFCFFFLKRTKRVFVISICSFILYYFILFFFYFFVWINLSISDFCQQENPFFFSFRITVFVGHSLVLFSRWSLLNLPQQSNPFLLSSWHVLKKCTSLTAFFFAMHLSMLFHFCQFHSMAFSSAYDWFFLISSYYVIIIYKKCHPSLDLPSPYVTTIPCVNGFCFIPNDLNLYTLKKKKKSSYLFMY